MPAQTLLNYERCMKILKVIVVLQDLAAFSLTMRLVSPSPNETIKSKSYAVYIHYIPWNFTLLFPEQKPHFDRPFRALYILLGCSPRASPRQTFPIFDLTLEYGHARTKAQPAQNQRVLEALLLLEMEHI